MKITKYGSSFTADTRRGPSKSLWRGCRTLDFIQNPEAGVYQFYDHFPLVAANTAATSYGDLQAYTGATAGSDITDAGIVGGGVKLESTTDDQGAAIRGLPAFKIALGQGRLWFEARFKQVNITDSKFNLFCGLIETGSVAATLPLTTSDAMADKNFVGFQRVFADGDALDSTYKADGVTQVTVGADAITTVADEFVKVGMFFDGTDLHFYKNGIRLADKKTIPSAAGTDFPNDAVLGICFGIMLGHGDTASATIDWIACAQESVA